MKTITQKQIDHVADTAQIIASNFDYVERGTHNLQLTLLLRGSEEELAMAVYGETDHFFLNENLHYAAVEQSLRCGVLPKGWVLK